MGPDRNTKPRNEDMTIAPVDRGGKETVKVSKLQVKSRDPARSKLNWFDVPDVAMVFKIESAYFNVAATNNPPSAPREATRKESELRFRAC